MVSAEQINQNFELSVFALTVTHLYCFAGGSLFSVHNERVRCTWTPWKEFHVFHKLWGVLVGHESQENLLCVCWQLQCVVVSVNGVGEWKEQKCTCLWSPSEADRDITHMMDGSVRVSPCSIRETDLFVAAFFRLVPLVWFAAFLLRGLPPRNNSSNDSTKVDTPTLCNHRRMLPNLVSKRLILLPAAATLSLQTFKFSEWIYFQKLLCEEAPFIYGIWYSI